MNLLLADLEKALARGTPAAREEALKYTTALLVSRTYDDDQIWIFGEVISKLMDELEEHVRAALSRRLCCVGNTPTQVANRLALDDSIEVAGPMLRHSDRIDPSALIEIVTTKEQPHLFAIAGRQLVDRPVTDILVRRGDCNTIVALVQNDGADFSEFGFLHLVRRSVNDSIIAEQLGLRKDIPRHVFQQLIAKASDEVRQKLLRERSELAHEINAAVIDVTASLHAKFEPASPDYFRAKRCIKALVEQGRLNEDQLCTFAQQRKRYETTVALATMCDLPLNLAERALLTPNNDLTLILAKSLELSWQTTMSLLFLGAPQHRISGSVLGQLQSEYALLNVQTSQEVVRIYRARKPPAAS